MSDISESGDKTIKGSKTITFDAKGNRDGARPKGPSQGNKSGFVVEKKRGKKLFSGRGLNPLKAKDRPAPGKTASEVGNASATPATQDGSAKKPVDQKPANSPADRNVADATRSATADAPKSPRKPARPAGKKPAGNRNARSSRGKAARSSGTADRGLSNQEQDSRARALELYRKRLQAEREAAEQAAREAEEQKRLAAEQQAAEQLAAEQERAQAEAAEAAEQERLKQEQEKQQAETETHEAGQAPAAPATKTAKPSPADTSAKPETPPEPQADTPSSTPAATRSASSPATQPTDETDSDAAPLRTVKTRRTTRRARGPANKIVLPLDIEAAEQRAEEKRKKEEARKQEEQRKKEEVREQEEKRKLEAARKSRSKKTADQNDVDDGEITAHSTPGKHRAQALPSKKQRQVETETASKKRAEPRLKGKLTITNALDDGASRRQPSLARLRRQINKKKRAANAAAQPREKVVREVILPDAITIQELSNRMSERSVDVIKFLMKDGQMMKINDVIDADTAELIADEFGHKVKRVSEADIEEGLFGSPDKEEDLKPRAPVVTVMGHVDHGKTSLLDALRKADVASGEAGGITQHIGAYQVQTDGGTVSFIDTPGHAAFTQMRARGAKVTDIVILVVAADDGVMPQTIEAINHAKAAEVPIIVAINKIDKPEANPARVRNELLQHEVFVESLGGDVLEVEVSAKQRTNLDKLLEAVLLQAELLELKANPERKAEGVIIEAQLERGRGPVGTMLVQRGTLAIGDILVAGDAWGKVRALINDRGQHVAKAGPSQPVEVLGFHSVPLAGDECAVVESEARAREITEYRERQRRESHAAGTGGKGSLEQMMSRLKEAGRAEFPLVIKGDVQGSVEAIAASLDKLGTDEVTARIVHQGVGGISESDITLADASQAVVIGFNVRANQQAQALAARDGIEIRYYSVIYDLVDDIKAAMSGLLAPEMRETIIGNAEILEVFSISKVGRIAGCRVVDGRVERGAGVRLIRDNVVVHEGKLSTLKRFKDEVSSVPAGQECGMGFENYQDIKAGDIIECFQVEEIARSL